MMYKKDTKFYKVTMAIAKDYEKLKDKKDSEIGAMHSIPSGIVSHIRRTIEIWEELKNA